MESGKAKARREREGFFEKYCQGQGIDIGCGRDPVTEDCTKWDKGDGDAQFMKGIEEKKYDWVYSSHCLEHLIDPAESLRNWWRILKSDGFLLLFLPHRDLYEKRKELPSKWNGDHKHFFLPDNDDPPDTLGIMPLIRKTLDGFDLIYCKTCNEGHTITDPDKHSNGEYSIEIVLRKIP